MHFYVEIALISPFFFLCFLPTLSLKSFCLLWRLLNTVTLVSTLSTWWSAGDFREVATTLQISVILYSHTLIVDWRHSTSYQSVHCRNLWIFHKAFSTVALQNSGSVSGVKLQSYLLCWSSEQIYVFHQRCATFTTFILVKLTIA